MQNIVIEKPYEFVPPHRGTLWSSIFKKFRMHAVYLRRNEGVVDYEIRHIERLRKSLDEGHGILLTPNHSRLADPLVLGWLACDASCHMYAMASWHLFEHSRFYHWAIRRLGAFSVYREGVDRVAINTAIEILETAERPLIVFPEGAVSRTNDRLHATLDGVAFIARVAARKRARRFSDGKVLVHPVAIKYFFQGDLKTALDPVLTEIEQRFSWQPQRSLSLLQRVAKVGRALLSLKELEYFGAVRDGRLADRLRGLIDRLLNPLEEEWLGEVKNGPVVPRVKELRMKILPEMVRGELPEPERQRRWRQLADIYLAQQVSSYPPDYLATRPSVDRILETVERYEEDLTDAVRVHGNLKAVLDVGEAIEVRPARERKRERDPLMGQIENQLQAMLDSLALESALATNTGA